MDEKTKTHAASLILFSFGKINFMLKKIKIVIIFATISPGKILANLATVYSIKVRLIALCKMKKPLIVKKMYTASVPV